MPTLQEYFNNNEIKTRIKLFFDGAKIGKLEGNALIIENFNNLEHIYISNLPNLTQLTLKDCPKLETLILHLDKEIEIILLDNIRLKNIKTSNSDKPIIIYQDKDKGGICWNCAINGLSLIGMVLLGVIVFYLTRQIKELREFIKELQRRLKYR